MARSQLLTGNGWLNNTNPPDRLVVLRATPSGPAATFAVWDDDEDYVYETVEQYKVRRAADRI